MLLVVSVAVMVAVPGTCAVARPPSTIETTSSAEELQVTVVVMSWVEPSENWPVAVNSCWSPGVIDGLSGSIVIDSNTTSPVGGLIGGTTGGTTGGVTGGVTGAAGTPPEMVKVTGTFS